MMNSFLISIIINSIFGLNLQMGGPYKSIVIGEQEWMTENLSVMCYKNGDTIPYVSDAVEWSKLTTGAWCYLDNNPANGKVYGKLYNWYAVADKRGLAPEGWHVPKEQEWTKLVDFLGGLPVAGGKMKKTGTKYWKKPNAGATNESKFNGLPGKYRTVDGSFNVESKGVWWTFTYSSDSTAWERGLHSDLGGMERVLIYKKCGLSVRCIKD